MAEKKNKKSEFIYPLCRVVSFDGGKHKFPVFMPNKDEAFTPLGFFYCDDDEDTISAWFPVDLKNKSVTVPSKHIAALAEDYLLSAGFEKVFVRATVTDCSDDVDDVGDDIVEMPISEGDSCYF